MSIYPGAKKLLIPRWNKVAITRHRRMNLHVAVSERDSLYSMFSNSNSACSHFYVAKDGTVEQYIDTKYRSASDMNGNDSTISVETQGGLGNSSKLNAEKWTDAQFNALVKLWKWARDTHNIKNQVAKNTQTNDNSAGLSWHRLGVQGNFAGRKGILSTSYKLGGIKYSSAAGKECPGDAKILQIPAIWEAANGKVAEPTKPAPSKPKPKPAPKGPNQSPTHTPDGSTNFPDSYVDLKINGNFLSWEVGALQILLKNVIGGENGRWDGEFKKLTITDTMTLMQRNGYYLKTPFAANGVAKGVPLDKDGKDGYWFWVEFQRMLGDDEGNRGKSYYNLKRFKLDGKPETETKKGIQRWLNDNN